MAAQHLTSTLTLSEASLLPRSPAIGERQLLCFQTCYHVYLQRQYGPNLLTEIYCGDLDLTGESLYACVGKSICLQQAR